MPDAEITPLISPDNVWGVWIVMAGWVAASIYLEQRHRWAAKVSGPVLILAGALTLSSLNVIPTASPAYDAVWDYIVPICIPLLLFRANIVVILRDSGPMFLVFHLAAIGTSAGAVIAYFVLRGTAIDDLGELIGIMTGSYTGGGVNFVALTKTFEPPESVTNALLVADNLVMAVLFLVCFALPSIPTLRRVFKTPYADEVERDGGGGDVSLAAEHWKPKPIGLLDIALALAVAVAVAGVAHLIAGAIKSALPSGGEATGGAASILREILGQPYLIITALCVLLASAGRRWLEKISGADELGTYLIYLFFFVIGAPANVIAIFDQLPELFVLCAIIAGTNLVVTLGLTWLLGRTLEEAALAVNATLGGAPSAAAMAIAKGWKPLVLPSILVGIWGYVVGTYIGWGIGRWLSS